MRFLAFILAALTLALLGCSSSPEPPATSEQHQQAMSDAEWQLRQSQQQPGINPKYPNQKPGVFSQPVEDPLNTGRDLDRP